MPPTSTIMKQSGNNLELDESKTKEIVIESKSVLSTLPVNNSVVDSFKLLVIYITPNILWSVHPQYMCKQLDKVNIFGAA